ncbi:MAG: HAD family hydrolase [Chloroflexi bacterium]|nr:MAG: HAD family hydrolase [Chloroflexota bacterium]
MQRAIVFDGDDTLWITEPLYDDARQRARAVVEAAGLDGAAWEELQRQMDVDNVERLGLAPTRFPTSCIEAYLALCAKASRGVDPFVKAALLGTAGTVFSQPAQPVPFAREALTLLRSRGYRLALLTKGDPALQRRRIDQSGLASLFDVIQIVDQKTPESIIAVLEKLGVSAGSALSVGNSLRSDVSPSLAAGVQPIWIDSHVWEYERNGQGVPDERVIVIEDLSRLLEVAS